MGDFLSRKWAVVHYGEYPKRLQLRVTLSREGATLGPFSIHFQSDFGYLSKNHLLLHAGEPKYSM